MPLLRSLLCTLMLLLLLARAGLALPMGAVVGKVESEVPGQVAVFQCQPGPMVGLKPGDVVSLVRSGAKLGEATVLRAAPDLVISLKGVFECAPGDLVVYLRRARAPEAPRPAAVARPAAPPPVGESPSGTGPAGAPEPPAPAEAAAIPAAPAIPEAPAPIEATAETEPVSTPPAAPPPPAKAAPAPPAAPAPSASAEDLATFQGWHGGLGARLKSYLRPRSKGKLASPHLDRWERAGALVAKARYEEAASLFGKLGTALQAEGSGVLGADPVRGREAWSLGLESLSLRGLCLVMADESGRARAAFEALARENPAGALASSRALSMVRGRANAFLKRLPPRPARKVTRP